MNKRFLGMCSIADYPTILAKVGKLVSELLEPKRQAIILCDYAEKLALPCEKRESAKISIASMSSAQGPSGISQKEFQKGNTESTPVHPKLQ